MNKPTDQDLQNTRQDPQELQPSETFPRDIIMEIKDLFFFRLNRNWRFDFIDKRIDRLTGYWLKDFQEDKMSWLKLLHPNDIEKFKQTIDKSLQANHYFSGEFRILTKEGERRWIKMRGPLHVGKDGNFSCMEGVMNDITAQKDMEIALESEHDIFVWVANCLEDGIYIVSEDYRITFMNKTLTDLVGNRVGETCYKALFGRETVCPWSVMHVIKQERCGFQEYRLPKLNKVFQVRSFPIRLRNGRIGKLGQLKDITQTKELRHEVKEYADRHDAIIDAANMAELGIFIIQNHDGIEARVRYVNEAFCRMTGYSQEELLGMSILDIIHPEHRKESLDRYRQRQRGKRLAHAYELEFVRKDGMVLNVFLSVALSSYERKIATIGFARDITETKRVQKSLWLSQRLASIGKLAAEIAHEINNPLTSVLTFSKLVDKILQQEPLPAERIGELRGFLGLMHTEASRCAEIARNLLDFSREGDMEVKVNDVHEIIDKTLDILRHRAQLNNIDIVTDYDLDGLQLACDFKRLQQAFINIFWNAIEAMPNGGILKVATRFDPVEEKIVIEISDTGIGIAEERLDSIFEPFFTTKQEGKGVGLGLSVAYGIIRQHQGEIVVSSTVGQGSRFVIRLPVNYCN